MKKGLIEVLFYIVLVFGVSFLLTTYVGQRTRVNGESMYPTLHDDDNLIVDKVSYRFSDPRRYDIIVFPYRYKDMYFIKRIIGLPGETVQILVAFTFFVSVFPQIVQVNVFSPRSVQVGSIVITPPSQLWFFVFAIVLPEEIFTPQSAQ